MRLKNNKKSAFTLVELILVIIILVALMYYIYPKITGGKNKADDTGRIKIAQDIRGYYQEAKASIGVFPGGGITNVGASVSEKALAKAVTSGTMSKGYYALFKFSGDRDSEGYFPSSPLKELQKYLVAANIIGSPSGIVRLNEGEEMIIFTSTTSKRMVGCVKTFASNETTMKDGDGIPDDKDPTGPDASKNGNRIYVFGDMSFWSYLNGENNASGEATQKCQDLVNPVDL